MKRTALSVILWGALVVLLGTPYEVYGLRRHERHRRVPGPEVLGSSDRELKDEQKENQYKPNFERCDDYKPEVLEESAAGKLF